MKNSQQVSRKQRAIWFSLLPIACCLLLLPSCDRLKFFEDQQQIENHEWKYDDAKTFTVDITDTTQHYDLLIAVRHSFNFEWRNVWVKIETTFPDSTKLEKRINLVLCEPDGHWFGDCTGDNCDIQLLVQNNARFPKAGKYSFKVTQDMRVNPLPLVSSVGLRIEEHQDTKPQQ